MTTKQMIIWGIVISALIAVIIGLTPNGWLRKLWSNIAPSGGRYYRNGRAINGTARTANGNNGSEEETCQFVDDRGKVVTLKGKGVAELCAKAKQDPYQRQYLDQWGYYGWYYPYSYYYYNYPYGYNWYYFPYYYTWNGGNGNGNGGNGGNGGAV